MARWIEDLFFGGERGGGKSDFQLGYQEDGALLYGRAWRGIVFRKTYPELEELQARAMEIFPGTGAIWKTQPSAQHPFSNCWYWPSGASVKMRYIEHERDYTRYHGHQYTGISFDEATEYESPAGLLKMVSTLRSAHGVPCTMRVTGNPGGIGHVWVKHRYVDWSSPYTPREDEGGMVRAWIPSRLSDNRALELRDPRYRARLLAATEGNEALRRAWLEGDWDVVAGAFFGNWNRRLHVVSPFELPPAWPRWLAFDWGSARPFCVLWLAHATTSLASPTFIPRGALVVFREWYGAKESAYNTGLKLSAEEVAAGILDRDQEAALWAQNTADPSVFRQDGGPSIAERMRKVGVRWRAGDNQRIAGWDQIRGRLTGEDGRPMLYVVDTCTHLIRTLPALQHDPGRLEDVDTDGEDHAGDALRYGCMVRPWHVAGKESDPRPKPGTFDWVVQNHEPKRQRYGRMP